MTLRCRKKAASAESDRAVGCGWDWTAAVRRERKRAERCNLGWLSWFALSWVLVRRVSFYSADKGEFKIRVTF